MTLSNSPNEHAVPVTLPAQAETALASMVSTAGCDFAALARAAGLDPARDFRGADLRGVDFGTSDLRGFDFSGADLLGCDLSAAKLDGTILTGARRGAEQRFIELHGHIGKVKSVAFSSDGNRIVCAGKDAQLLQWDASNGIALGKPMHGHTGIVWSAAYSPSGRQIASAGDDGTLRLWDSNTFSQVGANLVGHEGPVFTVAFSTDGDRIVSGGFDNNLQLWDVLFGLPVGPKMRGHTGQINCVVFSPDGQTVASASDDETIRLWDAETGEPLGQSIRGHSGWVNCISFSPDGQYIVSGGRDGTVRRWDAASGTEIGEPLLQQAEAISSVACSPDGRVIVSAGRDGSLCVLDTTTMQVVSKILCGHQGGVSSLAFSPDSSCLVSGGKDGKVLIWFLDPPVHQVFVTTRPEDEPYKRKLLDKLFAHPEMMKRNVVEAVLDPMTHPRPDEAARDALENSVAALFIVGDKDLAFMQHGELELARRLQRETGRPRIIPIFTSSAIPTQPPDALKDYHFVHMPLDKPAAFDALVEAISQTIDHPSVTSDAVTAAEVYRAPKEAPLTQPMKEAELEEWKRLRTQMNELDKARRTGKFSDISKWT